MIGAAIIGVFLVGGALAMARLRALPAAVPPTATHSLTVSVVVPARNEARSLPDLLGSLAAAGTELHEVIVVDDNSTDDTARVAAAHGATVIRLDGDPPAGWTGKNLACATGASAATAPLLLFVDADVILGRGSIPKLIVAHATRGGLVSVQPHHRVVRIYEELSAACNVVSMMGSGAFAAWSNRSRPAAFGPCLMTSAADYASVGGHHSVRDDVVEDVRLAHRYAAHGLPVTVLVGGTDVSFRMYPGGLGQLIEGWTKNLSAGSRLAHPLSVVVAVGWVTACLSVGVLGIRSVFHARTIEPRDAALHVALWMAVAIEFRWMLRRIGAFRWLTAVLHPLPMWAFVGLFLRSTWLNTVRRTVRWRGRQVAARRFQSG